MAPIGIAPPSGKCCITRLTRLPRTKLSFAICPPLLPPVSSRYSHALAVLQSRITVTADTLSTTAVSSTLSPPKKTHLDYLYFARVEPRQRVHRITKGHEIRSPLATNAGRLL